MRKRGEKQPSKVDHKDAAVASAKAYGEVSPYVMHPNTQFRGLWDAVQIAILCYVALAVPYRMGFGADAYGGWYVFEVRIGAFPNPDTVYCPSLSALLVNIYQYWQLLHTSQVDCLPIQYTHTQDSRLTLFGYTHSSLWTFTSGSTWGLGSSPLIGNTSRKRTTWCTWLTYKRYARTTSRPGSQ